MAEFRAIMMKAADSVCTVVQAVAPGSEVAVNLDGKVSLMRVTEAIPFGHKFAVRDIASGDAIMKYGEIIGLATQNIKAGQHVHVHNLESCRGRGE